MIRFDPSLLVQRVLVLRENRSVYEEKFHVGINVIRGENSSGKSTILNFIFYGLGGDLSDWSDAALLCSRVIIEVSLSGMVATLSRDVTTSLGAPMEIFGGSLEDAMVAPRAEWMRYPYRKSQSKESFSQAIFRLLNMPEVTSDTSGNVTVHQMLRLLYADQLSPVDDLFRFERFDQAVLRDNIGRLLCCAYTSTLYDNEQKIRLLGREFDDVRAELRSLFVFIGKTDQPISSEWVESERAVLKADVEQNRSQIEEAQRALLNANDKLTLQAQEESYREVQLLQRDLSQNRAERNRLALALVDSDAFIKSLLAKVESLRDSQAAASNIERVRFESCPACFAVVEEINEAEAHACHLCKTPFDVERARSRMVALINEAAVQIKQSELLQAKREEEAASLDDRYHDIRAKWQTAARSFESVRTLPSTEAQQRMNVLVRQSGYLERQLEDLDRKSQLIDHIQELSHRRDLLNAEISRLKNQNEALRLSQQKTLGKAYTSISKEVRNLLRGDLRRQDSFETAEIINFSFNDNDVSVDGNTYFSASSRAILKSSFVFGFLTAAAKMGFFRHPRFCMIDTLENMGVEVQRSHKFQMQMLDVSKSLGVQHQIIYGTAMIAPALDEPAYTVGRFSTRDQPSLSLL